MTHSFCAVARGVQNVWMYLKNVRHGCIPIVKWTCRNIQRNDITCVCARVSGCECVCILKSFWTLWRQHNATTLTKRDGDDISLSLTAEAKALLSIDNFSPPFPIHCCKRCIQLRQKMVKIIFYFSISCRMDFSFVHSHFTHSMARSLAHKFHILR